jgi:hypothetical protein
LGVGLRPNPGKELTFRKPQRSLGWVQQIDNNMAARKKAENRDEWRRLMREAKAQKGL